MFYNGDQIWCPEKAVGIEAHEILFQLFYICCRRWLSFSKGEGRYFGSSCIAEPSLVYLPQEKQE